MVGLLGKGGANNQLRSKRESTRVQPRSDAINPGGVGQIGVALGNHSEYGPARGAVEPMRVGPGFGRVPLGNAKATDVGCGGPGAGRTVSRTGSQAQHGPAAPGSPPPEGSVFAGWPKRSGS
jgi:hypothetical protein